MKKPQSLPDDVLALAKARIQARQDKAWKLSDELRQQITQLGYTVEDTPAGQKISKSL